MNSINVDYFVYGASILLLVSYSVRTRGRPRAKPEKVSRNRGAGAAKRSD